MIKLTLVLKHTIAWFITNKLHTAVEQLSTHRLNWTQHMLVFKAALVNNNHITQVTLKFARLTRDVNRFYSTTEWLNTPHSRTCCWIFPSSVTTQCVVARPGSASNTQIKMNTDPRTDELQKHLFVEWLPILLHLSSAIFLPSVHSTLKAEVRVIHHHLLPGYVVAPPPLRPNQTR